MSATDAIVSVTSNSMRADLDAFWKQFDELKAIDQKLMAQGTATAENLGLQTTLPAAMTRNMAHLRTLDDELKERREHDKKLAQIEASGPYRAEIVNRVLTGVGILLGLFVAWYLGTQSGE